MKILISYFYQIRFFKPNYIPLSTAMSDPKWFHQNRGKSFYYKDKRGVYNGLRAEPFVPVPDESLPCPGPQKCEKVGTACAPLGYYYGQLKNLDFNSIMKRFQHLGNLVKEIENFSEEPIPVLIVHEPPNCPCSEREVIKRWFFDNGYILEEFDKSKI